MELTDIDFKIKQIQNSDVTEENILKLIQLLSKKIIKITGEEDLRQFSSIVKELKLNKRDEENLINLAATCVNSWRGTRVGRQLLSGREALDGSNLERDDD